MKSLRYLLAMVAVALFTAACVSEPVPYQKGEAEADGCYGVYFPVQDATGSHTYDPSQATEVLFKVARTNSNDAITVPVTYTESHEGIFKLEELKFDAGQSETTLKVTFPESGNGIDYKLSLAIEDPQYASKYNDGATNIDFSVLRVQWNYFLNPQTNEPAVFTFTQGWWEEVHTGKVKYYEVDGVRTCMTETDPLVYSDGTTGYGFWGTATAPGEGEITFKWYLNEVDLNGNQIVEVPVTYVYDNSTYEAPVHMYDYYTYFTVLNPQAALQGVDYLTFVRKYGSNYITSYYDNGGFYFAVSYYYMIGIGGWSVEDYDVTCLADGFVRTDYSLDVESDYTQGGVTPFAFEAGADVAKIDYVVVEGEANVLVIEEMVKALTAGTAENTFSISAEEMSLDEEENKRYGYVEVTCPSTGKYTLVAVGFDAEGNAQGSTSVVFDYVAADDATYDVKFDVEVADTPERFAKDGHTIYNSFSFTVYGGNGLTDAKIGLYETKLVETAGIDAVVADLRYEDDKINMSVLPDTLARINTIAGYTDLYSGLKDNTSYTLVVWGTNGMQTSVVTAEYTTEMNPEVFKSLGMAQYTEDYLFGLYNGLENVTYEVEIQESVDNPGKYRLVNPYGEAYPYNEPGDWDDSQDYYMVIDAQVPDAVYIPLQGVGCDWGYGEWTVYSEAAYYLDNGKSLEEVKDAGKCGTLKDGVITFPVKSLLITAPGLGGNLYLANTAGAFKVVLPGYGEDVTPEEGAETTAVSKSSIQNLESSFELPKSTGRIVGAGIEPEVRTVKATAVISANQGIRKSVNRNCEINHSNIEVNF